MKPITIESGGEVISQIVSGSKFLDLMQYLEGYPSIYVLCDSKVEPLAHELEKALLTKQAESPQDKLPALKAIASIETSEHEKTMGTVLEICNWLLESGADRDALLLAIGGGITTDIAGFAASIYKRGISFAFVPTTVLAQVDAAIGGKTGVNMLDYKNMIGIIRQPDFTFECPEVLKTLPYRDFVSGTSELIKTFIIENEDDNYTRTIRLLSAINGAESRSAAIEEYSNDILSLIYSAAAVKAGVVGRDQFENGERRKLNLGHTFAHAIEHVAQGHKVDISLGQGVKLGKDHDIAYVDRKDITHGEAVAMGMVLAAKLSEKVGVAKDNLAAKLANNLAACGLPTESPYSLDELAEAMTRDKKAEEGKIHFVLIQDIGDVILKDLSVDEAIKLLEA